MKVLRKLLAFLVVIALLGGGAVYALQPSEDIKPSEKLIIFLILSLESNSFFIIIYIIQQYSKLYKLNFKHT